MPNRQDEYLDYEDGKMQLEAEQAGLAEHPSMTGDAREQIVLKRLRFLPKRFTCAGGKVLGRDPDVSRQIDILICDELDYVCIPLDDGSLLAAPESVFAALSVKSTTGADLTGHEVEARDFQEHVSSALGEPWPGICGLVAYSVSGNRIDQLAQNFTTSLQRPARERLALLYIPGGIVLADAERFGLDNHTDLPARGGSITDGVYRADGVRLFATVVRLLERHLNRMRRLAPATSVIGSRYSEAILTESAPSVPPPTAMPLAKQAALLDLGARAKISLGVRNDSSTAWSTNTGTEANLRFSTVASSTGSDRVLVEPIEYRYAQQTEEVAPGEVLFFEVPIDASVEGAHDLVFELSTGGESTGVQLHGVVAVASRGA